MLDSIEKSSWSTVELSDSNNRGNRVVETESNIKGLKECWVPRNQNSLIHVISKGVNPPSKDKTDKKYVAVFMKVLHYSLWFQLLFLSLKI